MLNIVFPFSFNKSALRLNNQSANSAFQYIAFGLDLVEFVIGTTVTMPFNSF